MRDLYTGKQGRNSSFLKTFVIRLLDLISHSLIKQWRLLWPLITEMPDQKSSRDCGFRERELWIHAMLGAAITVLRLAAFKFYPATAVA